MRKRVVQSKSLPSKASAAEMNTSKAEGKKETISVLNYDIDVISDGGPNPTSFFMTELAIVVLLLAVAIFNRYHNI